MNAETMPETYENFTHVMQYYFSAPLMQIPT